MQVWVYHPHRQMRFSVEVPRGATAQQLKEIVARERRMPLLRHDVVFNSSIIADGARLADAGVEGGSTVHVTKRMLAAKVAAAERVARLAPVISLLDNATLARFVNSPPVALAVAGAGAALEAVLRRSPTTVALLNSGPLCRQLLPALAQAVLAKAPRLAVGVQMMLARTPGLSELAPRAVAVVLSELDSVAGACLFWSSSVPVH
jgi:hypothetical protein